MTKTKLASENPKVVSQAEWVEARKAHLAKEKEFTRLRDQLSADRRELPWVKIDKEYVFDGPSGKRTLAELFEGRSQLIVYHFMWRWDLEAGCPSCSFVVDNVSGGLVHLENHDVKFVAVSRAPLPKLEGFKQRMGWDIDMVSSFESDFNFDFHVSFTDEEMAAGKMYYNYEVQKFPSNEAPGASVFMKDEAGDIYHTYSTFTRGLDILLGTYNLLDMTPKGRNEKGGMEWLRYHDEYPHEVKDQTQGSEACH
jgi:predicted dithiol-disulfide oxidoreductase (DUF899 family)